MELKREAEGLTWPQMFELHNSLCNSEYRIKKYADKLKDITCLIIGCTREQLEDRVFKETPIPQFTKYQVTFNYYYKDNSLKSRPVTKVFDSLNCAETFIANGIWDDFTISDSEIDEIYTTPRDLQNIFGTDCGRGMVHPNIWCEALFSDYKGYTPKKADINTMNFLELYTHTSCRDCGQRYSGYKRQYACGECIDKNAPYYPNWLITDVRFSDNEGQYIKDRGGIVIGVKRNFALRFPEYKDLVDKNNPYDIPEQLKTVDSILYKRLTSASELSMGDYKWCDYIVENNGSIEDLIIKIKTILWK